MENPVSLDHFLQRLADGDGTALEPLLLANHDRLLQFVQRQLPTDLRRVVEAEDVLQEVFVEGFKRAGQFKNQGVDCFYRWLATIARHKLLDLIAAHRAAKRGGGLQVELAASNDRSPAQLLDVVNFTSETPSRLYRKQEAVAALRVALAGLPQEMKMAVEMKYIHHLSPADMAKALHKTVGATNVLCHRALKRIRESLGRASSFMSAIG